MQSSRDTWGSRVAKQSRRKVLQSSSPLNRKHLLFVGGGPATTLILRRLAENREPFANLQITILEKGGRVGPGTPHATRNPAQVVNMRVALHSVKDWQPFAEFVIKRGFDPESPVPRFLVGDYLAEAAADAISRLDDSGCKVSCLAEEAVSIRRSFSGFEIATFSGLRIYADFVICATGHDPAAFEKPALENKHVA